MTSVKLRKKVGEQMHFSPKSWQMVFDDTQKWQISREKGFAAAIPVLLRENPLLLHNADNLLDDE